MNNKKIAKHIATYTLALGMLTACASSATTPTYATQVPIVAETPVTPPEVGVRTNVRLNVLPSPLDFDPTFQVTLPAGAMSMETAAQAGAQYIYDVTGINIDGMHVVMNKGFMLLDRDPVTGDTVHLYSWHGAVSATREATGIDAPGNEHGLVEILFTFEIDAVTGDRMRVWHGGDAANVIREQVRELGEEAAFGLAYEFNAGSRAFFASEAGQTVLAKDNDQRAALVGLSADDIQSAFEQAYAIANSHFNLSELVNLELNYTRTIVVPLDEPFTDEYGWQHDFQMVEAEFAGIIIGLDRQIFLDTAEHVLVLESFIFTATDDAEQRIEIQITPSSGAVEIRPALG